MRFYKKRILAVFLMISLIVTSCMLPAAAEKEETDNLYVYLGDSMSFNFTQRHNYYYSTYIYPQQTADAMGLTLTDAGTLPGGRFTDAYAMMSDYNGDAYTWDELYGYISSESERQKYTESIKAAKVITTQMGYSGISMYMLKNMLSVVKGEGLLYDADLCQIFTDSEIGKIDPLVAEYTKRIKDSVGTKTLTALRTFLQTLSEKQKAAFAELFGSEFINILMGSPDMIKQLSDNIRYTIAAQIIHFDRTIERIYELNPDVELYVMGLANPMQHMSLGFTVGGMKYSIDIGDMLGYIFDIFNLYMKVQSPNAMRYYFVDNCESVENYGQAMAKDIEVAKGILYTYYNHESFTGHDVPGTYAYQKAEAMAPGVQYALKNTSFIDLSKIAEEVKNGVPDISNQQACFDKLDQLDENGMPKASYLEQAMAHIYMLTMMIGIYVHPTQNAHDAEAVLLIEAMKTKQINRAAIIYHTINKPAEILMDVRKTVAVQLQNLSESITKTVKEKSKGSILSKLCKD